MNNNVKILKDELGISTLRIDDDAIVGFDVERFWMLSQKNRFLIL